MSHDPGDLDGVSTRASAPASTPTPPSGDLAPRPAPSEQQRLAELEAYQVLDTDPEPGFDGLVQLAATIAGVPTALIGLIDADRQWYKARFGAESVQIDRDLSFCDHVLRGDTEMIVPDAALDPRFQDHPLVIAEAGVRFYAGFPLRAPSGAVLGTLCVSDSKPQQLREQQVASLRALADQVMTQFQLRREVLERDQRCEERDRLMARLSESERRHVTRDAAIAATAAKSAFLATMSHEIRTPMNAVIGMTGRLLDTALDAEQRNLLETVKGSGNQLLSIINDILDFSKIESGELELDNHPFELRETVESTIAQFAGSAGQLDLISYLTEDCPAVAIGDVVRLRQVLTNLVGNAVKFTDHGDVLLRVELDSEPPDPERAGDPLPASTVRLRFTVADSGIGIAPENLARLFTSFSQVDASTTGVYGGTGLGLAISKALVEAMGGRLSVTSSLGTGSEFTFALVLGRSGDRRLASGRRPEGGGGLAQLADRNVLVVDDNDTNCRILREQLEGYGLICTTRASAEDALALVGGGRSFDLAILDFAMPMMDGAELATALHRLPAGRRLPLILLSGLGRDDREDDGLFAAVLTKPVRSTALFEAITQVLSVDPVAGPHWHDPGPAQGGSWIAHPLVPLTAVPRPAGPGQPEDRGQPSQPGQPSRLSRLGQPGRRSSQGYSPTSARRSGDRRLRILLAEDDEANQKVGKLMLSKIGHQVDLAQNGRDALDAVRRSFYDVVLMDLHLPVMDGLESTRRIRADLTPEQQPYIIALTANATDEDRAACAEAGMDTCLPKPVQVAELAAALAVIARRT